MRDLGLGFVRLAPGFAWHVVREEVAGLSFARCGVYVGHGAEQESSVPEGEAECKNCDRLSNWDRIVEAGGFRKNGRGEHVKTIEA